MDLESAIKIFNNERSQENLFALFKILCNSDIIIPCNAIMANEDNKSIEEMIKQAGDNLDSLKGMEFTNQQSIRMVPDILQNGDDYFFPVFTSVEAMGDYGNNFSKMESEFVSAINLARTNDRNLQGIVINAFSEPFVLITDLYNLIERMHNEIECK